MEHLPGMMVDTGGRHKRAEASPRSDRSRFEAIFENTPLVAIQGYDPDGVIRHWNTASTHLYGYARNEILGRRMQDVLFTGNEVGKFERIVRGITESGCAAPAMNWEIKTKDGSFKWVHSTMFPIIEDDKIVEIFCMDVDITRMKAVEEDLRRARDNLESIVEERSSELKHKNRSLVQEIARRKKIEDELNEIQQFQSTLISNLPGMVYRRREDDDMTMEFVSEGCADLTGYNPDDLISGPITYTSLIHPEDKNRVRSEIRQALREDQAFRLRYRITSADASEKWVYEQGRAITCTVDGQSVIEGFVSDITEQMRAEEAVEVAKAQAELYLELICHDINNMNQRGMGFIDVAMNSPDLHQDQMKLLSCTLQALQDSSELISNVAKLQLIHSCGISRGIVDIGSLLKELIPLYTSMPGRNISIIYVPVSGCYVIANELVRDVFSNILGNSLKHSSGDLEIVICLDSVYLNNTKYSRISFEDNGPGIDDPMKSRLFKRFERGDTRASGKGLGLYLVRMLVEEFQGIVWVEDRISGDPGNGCRFVVLLPAAEKPGLENN